MSFYPGKNEQIRQGIDNIFDIDFDSLNELWNIEVNWNLEADWNLNFDDCFDFDFSWNTDDLQRNNREEM